MDKGIKRVVLGTKACEDESFLKGLIDDFGEGIIVSIDSRAGKVAIHGWAKDSSWGTLELAKRMVALGVRSFIYTDISRDGTLRGIHLGEFEKFLNEVNVPAIASGGISSLEDIETLKSLESRGLSGVIVGRALYEGKISLKEAIEKYQ